MKTYSSLIPLALRCITALGFGLFLNVGCGGVSADLACSDYAKAACAKLDQCHKNGTQLSYGNLGTCIDRQKVSCMNSLAAPSTGSNPGDMEACAMALPGESCQDYLRSNPVDACVPKNGSLQIGAACAFSPQCDSGFCAISRSGNCGTCQNKPAVGDPCTDNGCGRNLVCTANLVCAAWGEVGAACDAKNNVCAPGTACVIASGMTTGTCQQRGTDVGTTCDLKRQTGPDCDPNSALFCNSVTLKCAALSYGTANQACGLSVSKTTDTVCSGGGACISPGAGSTPACVAAVPEGNSCDTAAGPPCLSPSRCVTDGTSTSGTCMVLDGTMCM